MNLEQLLDKVLLCQYMAEKLARGSDDAVQMKLVEKLAELYQELGAFIVEQADKQPQSLQDYIKSLPTTTITPPKQGDGYLPGQAIGRCAKCGITLSQVMCYSCPNNDCPCGMGSVSCTAKPGLSFNAVDGNDNQHLIGYDALGDAVYGTKE